MTANNTACRFDERLNRAISLKKSGNIAAARAELLATELLARAEPAPVYALGSLAQTWVSLFGSDASEIAYSVLLRCEQHAMTDANMRTTASELWDCATWYGIVFGKEAVVDIERCLRGVESMLRNDSFALSITARIWLESFEFNPNSAAEAQRLCELACTVGEHPGDIEFNEETADMIREVLAGTLR